MFYMSIVDGGYKVSSTSAQNNIVSKMRNVMVSFGLTNRLKCSFLGRYALAVQCYTGYFSALHILQFPFKFFLPFIFLPDCN